MNLYNINCGTIEGEFNVVLTHEKSYTQEEFNEILSSSYLHLYKESVSHQISEDYHIRYHFIYTPQIESLSYRLVDYLIGNYGFKNIEPNCTFVTNGWLYPFQKSNELELSNNHTSNKFWNELVDIPNIDGFEDWVIKNYKPISLLAGVKSNRWYEIDFDYEDCDHNLYELLYEENGEYYLIDDLIQKYNNVKK